MAQLIQKKLVSLPQAAFHFGVSDSTFKKWLRDNEGLRRIARKPGRRVLFVKDDLDIWWDAQILEARRGA
jgi:excisionase family DNA binding protein